MASNQYKNTYEQIHTAKKLRKEAPLSERLLWNALSEMRKETGLKFRRQHPMKPYFADFVCVLAKLAIEIDGMSHDTKQTYDKVREEKIQNEGWTVIRFTNEDVLNNLEGVATAITNKAEELAKLGKR